MNIRFTCINQISLGVEMVKTRKLIIFGSGTLAEIADFYFTNDSCYQVIAFVESDSFPNHSVKVFNRPLLSFTEMVKSFTPTDVEVFVAIGYKKTNRLRRERFDQVQAYGYKLASYISTKAINFSLQIGANCFILENNVLQPFTQIEDCVTMWSGNHLGHHSIVRSNCFITSQVVVSGKCEIGSYSFLGVNSTIHDGVRIGESSIIGAGSIVVTSCEDRSVFSPIKTEFRKIARDVI